MLCRILSFFRRTVFASCPSLCQIGRLPEKSELLGKYDVNITRGNVGTNEQILPFLMRGTLQSPDVNSSA